jgi:NlpE N-terminal domain
MKRLKLWMITAIPALLVACGGNDSNKAHNTADTTNKVAVAIKPSGPPEKVSGSFKGVLPCSNCTETEAILTIKDDQYSYTRLLKGMKTRGSNINTKSGTCLFDIGIVKLLTNNVAEDMFRIVSEDTLKLLDAKGKPTQGKTDHFLIRSTKQEKL